MRELVPTFTDDVDIHEFYARGWIDEGGLRMNFVSSLDGAASIQGQSRGLQTPGDNAVFAAMRDLADVVLVGAGTARDEGYRPSKPGAQRRANRERFGLAPVPPIALVSRALTLDPAWNLFTGAEPDVRTVVITCAASDPSVRAALAEVADVLVLGDESVDLAAILPALGERGLTRVLGEGGPSIFGEFAAAGLVDELCLSVSPLLAGPGPQRITHGMPWPDGPRPYSLYGLLEEDGALFGRYHAVR
jgi:riboflavin biosynthesis pyrimidine reductase